MHLEQHGLVAFFLHRFQIDLWLAQLFIICFSMFSLHFSWFICILFVFVFSLVSGRSLYLYVDRALFLIGLSIIVPPFLHLLVWLSSWFPLLRYCLSTPLSLSLQQSVCLILSVFLSSHLLFQYFSYHPFNM